MKKLLSLLMMTVLFITVIGVAPVVSAEEIQYEYLDEKFIKKYWWSYWGENDVVKIGDWYYKFTNTYYGDRYLSGVCGYDGDETEITIPTELDGEEVKAIEKFYLFSDTVKTINIPKGIRFKDVYHGNEYMRFHHTTNLEEIVVEEGNSSYRSNDGILFKGSELCLYPPAKKGSEYVIPSGVGRIATGAFCGLVYLKSLTIPQNVSVINEDAIAPGLENLYFDTTMDLYTNLREEHWSSESGYSYVEMPRVPNGTIHCIYGTQLYEYYNKSWNKGYFFKEFKTIPRKAGESLIKEDGVWYYYDNGEKTVRNTLIKHSGEWFYINNGIWDKTVSDKIIKYKEKWFYIKNGKWNSDVNTLIKLDGEWFGIVNGKWDTSAKTLVKYSGKWFYVKNGKWCKDTAIVKYEGKRFYVKSGKVDFDYSGSKKIDGKTYKIKNGKVA